MDTEDNESRRKRWGEDDSFEDGFPYSNDNDDVRGLEEDD